MAKKFPPRVRVNCATIGTGTLTLGTPTSTRFQSIPASYDLATVDYAIEDGTAWEEGYGIYESAFGTLTRNLISSSTGSLLDLTGNAVVFSTIASRTMDSLFEDVVIVPEGTALPVGDGFVDIDTSSDSFRTLVVTITDAQFSGFAANRLQLLWSTDGISFVGGLAIASNAAGVATSATSNISTSPVALAVGATEDRIIRIEGAHEGPGTLVQSIGRQPGTASPNYQCHAGILNKNVPIAALRIGWSGIATFDGAGTYGVYGRR